MLSTGFKFPPFLTKRVSRLEQPLSFRERVQKPHLLVRTETAHCALVEMKLDAVVPVQYQMAY